MLGLYGAALDELALSAPVAKLGPEGRGGGGDGGADGGADGGGMMDAEHDEDLGERIERVTAYRATIQVHFENDDGLVLQHLIDFCAYLAILAILAMLAILLMIK